MIWRLIRKLLFIFDAETVHHFTLLVIRWTQILIGNRPLVWISGGGVALSNPSSKTASTQVCGLDWRSPIGLAAGMDKDAEILAALPALGFGFAEIGTVTPRPQLGNPQPRLFRDADRQIVFNRMGFNGLGALQVAENIRTIREQGHIPLGFNVGINVGKNKDTAESDAAKDFVLATQPFRGLVDYVVVNVSSPNTPGLRDLQTASKLRPIIEGVARELQAWRKIPPLFLKLAPEMTGSEFSEILDSGSQWGVNGWILTNTLKGEWKSGGKTYEGGLSGSILSELSLSRLREARSITRLPLISVGGILTEQDALDRIREGAALIQVYSGWIMRGPRFPRMIEKAYLEAKK